MDTKQQKSKDEAKPAETKKVELAEEVLVSYSIFTHPY